MLKYTPVSERSLSKPCPVLSCFAQLGSWKPSPLANWSAGGVPKQVRRRSARSSSTNRSSSIWSRELELANRGPSQLEHNRSQIMQKYLRPFSNDGLQLENWGLLHRASLANRTLYWVSRIIFCLTKDLPGLCLNTSSQYPTISTWGSLRSPF